MAAFFSWYWAQVQAKGGFLILLAYTLLVVLSERGLYALSKARRAHWNERDAITNIVISSTNTIASTLGLGLLYTTAYFWVFENIAPAQLPIVWWAFLVAFVLNDFVYWLDHYISHKNGLFWTLHHAHHSSREMNLTVALRGHVLLPLFQPAYLLLALCGVPFAMALAVKVIGNLWGIFNHTRLVHRMGPLEGWLCTPANHRVHHGTQAKYLDRNFGQTLLVWDRMFGTWQREEEEPVYGLVRQLPKQDYLTIQTAPILGLWRVVRSAPTLRGKLGYLWHPPGWSHTGQHERTQELQARERADRGVPDAGLLTPAE